MLLNWPTTSPFPKRMRLNLDGISHFHEAMEYTMGSAENPKRVWLFRITAVAQAALALMSALAVQLGRALMHFVTLHPARAKEGMRDLLSLGVQALALPLLGCAATFSPLKVASWIAQTLNFESQPRLPKVSPLQDKVSKCVGGILAFPVNMTYLCTFTLSTCLTANLKQIKEVRWGLLGCGIGFGTFLSAGTLAFHTNFGRKFVETTFNLEF